ncbi:small ribosomal subunit protein mS34-like [Watersipora subatra]|uniref:small ribosomal subunit protein mS34-like n=1 Tax=Watersipora subatra TaxID=2589382 RepID=UPI00355C8C50
MATRHIGRVGTYKGKFLFHLLCNLNGSGVGRMVVRKSFNERYKEPSYYIIKKSCPDYTSEDLKAGYILAKQVFRGKVLGEEKRINSGFKPDWELVPKSEEQKYLENTLVYESREAPVSMDMPPLLRRLVTDRCRKQGVEPKPEDLKLLLQIQKGEHNRARQPLVEEVIKSLPEEECPPPPLTWKQVLMLKRYKKKGKWLNVEELRKIS